MLVVSFAISVDSAKTLYLHTNLEERRARQFTQEYQISCELRSYHGIHQKDRCLKLGNNGFIWKKTGKATSTGNNSIITMTAAKSKASQIYVARARAKYETIGS